MLIKQTANIDYYRTHKRTFGAEKNIWRELSLKRQHRTLALNLHA